jgi:hypothetical protein
MATISRINLSRWDSVLGLLLLVAALLPVACASAAGTQAPTVTPATAPTDEHALTIAPTAAPQPAEGTPLIDYPQVVDKQRFVIFGTLTNRTANPIPNGTRLLVAWAGGGDPDYTYVFGEGTVRTDTNTFELAFTIPPTVTALNSSGLGVGFLFLTINTTLQGGSDMEDVPETEIIGAAEQYAVIYLAHEPARVRADREWAGNFHTGYNVGKGIDLPGIFDGFEPVNPSSVEIIVDSLNNLTFVNWS